METTLWDGIDNRSSEVEDDDLMLMFTNSRMKLKTFDGFYFFDGCVIQLQSFVIWMPKLEKT